MLFAIETRIAVGDEIQYLEQIFEAESAHAAWKWVDQVRLPASRMGRVDLLDWKLSRFSPAKIDSTGQSLDGAWYFEICSADTLFDAERNVRSHDEEMAR